MNTNNLSLMSDSRAAAGAVAPPTRGQRTRAGLVTAAKVVFEGTPFADTRITDITAQAGVATGTFYTHFSAKEEIFREVAVEVLAAMASSGRLELDAIDHDPIAGEGGVAATIRRYYLTCLDNAGVARSIEQVAALDPDVARARRETVVEGVKQVQRWIRELQRRGICDTEIDAWTTAMVLHTMTVRVAYDHLLASGEGHDLDRLVEAVAHVWARTVGLEEVADPRPLDAATLDGMTGR